MTVSPALDAALPRVGTEGGRPSRRRLGAPLGYIDPERHRVSAFSHLWLLTWLLVAALGAVVITPPESSLAIWWPATFVGVGVLLQAPRSRWPWLVPVMAATISLGQIMAGRAADLSVGLGSMTALESLAIVLVLRQLHVTTLCTVADVGRLLIADAAGGVVFAIGLAPLMGLLPGADYLDLLGQVTLSHVTAALCLGPLFLTLPSVGARISREQASQWVLLVGVELWIFATTPSPAVAFALLPILLWGAVRQSARAVAAQSTTVAALALLFFSFGRGPFRVGPDQPYADWAEATISLQLFLSVLALTALVVATGSAQQRRAADEARRESAFAQTVLATTDALTMVLDASGRIELVNGAAERATGFRAGDLLGRPIWETLVPPDQRDAARRRFAEAADPADFRLGEEEEFWTRDGLVRRLRVSTSVLDRGEGGARSIVITGIDVTDERRTRDLLSRMLQASSSTAAIGVDLDGSISLFSRGAVELLGYDEHTALGACFTRLIATGTCDGDIEVDATAPAAAEIDRVAALLAGGSVAPARDWWWRCASGQVVAVSQTMDEVTDGSGRRTGYLVIARDVTEERRSQEILLAALRREREAVERLRTLDAAKSEFVTTVSHELRTPVSSIVGYAEIFADESDDEGLAPVVDAIARNGYRLRDLADALVTLSDLDARQGHGASTVDLRERVAAAIDDCRAAAARRGQRIRILDGAGDDCPLLLQGDERHLRLAVSNVVQNALKFSADGAEISVDLLLEQDRAIVRVVDSGMGIPPDEVDVVFARFHRARNAHAEAIQGPGLGLSLVRTIMQLHGGSVALRSEEGVGTEVDLVFPLPGAVPPVPPVPPQR